MTKFIPDHKILSKVLPTIGRGSEDSLHIALLYGGISAEREPSLLSGKNVMEAVKDLDYRITPIDVGVDISEVLREIKPNVVFNALHGTFGEDGCIQGLLEILGIPYTHSKVLASAIALDKIYSQQIFKLGGLKCPERVVVTKGDDLSVEPIKRPYVIKPVDQGSSLGVEVIFEGDNFNLKDYPFAFGDKAIIEEYIKGHEVQVAVLAGRAVGTLEVICLKGKRFNDYDCKYRDGYSRHDCPGNFSKEAQEKMMRLAELAHNIIGCRGLTRAEFRYDAETDEAYFLEINTHPGLTALSSVTDIIKHSKISMADLFISLINEALNER